MDLFTTDFIYFFKNKTKERFGVVGMAETF